MSHIPYFRAWDKKNNRMCDVWAIHWKAWDDFPEQINFVEVLYDDGTYELMEHEVELLRFIGMQDKNGKPIYESYICKNGDWETDAAGYNYRIEEIIYHNDSASFSGWNHNCDGMTCEVIGNIYENPDLLE